MTNEQKLREALQALLASGGVIAEAADDELQAAIDDPDAEEIVKVQAAAVLNARQALATTAPVMANGLTEAETDVSASVVGLTAAPMDEQEAFEQVIVAAGGDGAVARWPNEKGASYENARVQDYRQGWLWCLEWQARAAMAEGANQ